MTNVRSPPSPPSGETERTFEPSRLATTSPPPVACRSAPPASRRAAGRRRSARPDVVQPGRRADEARRRDAAADGHEEDVVRAEPGASAAAKAIARRRATRSKSQAKPPPGSSASTVAVVVEQLPPAIGTAWWRRADGRCGSTSPLGDESAPPANANWLITLQRAGVGAGRNRGGPSRGVAGAVRVERLRRFGGAASNCPTCSSTHATCVSSIHCGGPSRPWRRAHHVARDPSANAA